MIILTVILGGCVSATSKFSQDVLSEIDMTKNGTDFGYIDISEQGYSYHKPEYNLVKKGEWGVSFDYGTVKGVSKCSVHSGNLDVIDGYNTDRSGWIADEKELDVTGKDTKGCWCSLTAFNQKEGDSFDLSGRLWIYNGSEHDAKDCAVFCANNCAKEFQNTGNFRRAMFSVFPDTKMH